MTCPSFFPLPPFLPLLQVPVQVDDSQGYKSVYISLPRTLNLFGIETLESNTTIIASAGTGDPNMR